MCVCMTFNKMKKTNKLLVTLLMLICIYILILSVAEIKIPIWSIVIFVLLIGGSLITFWGMIYAIKREESFNKEKGEINEK